MDLEGRARARQVLDRRVLLAGLEVVEDEVAVRERAALGVLAGEPDRDAVRQQAPNASPSAWRPVDAALLAERVAAALELPSRASGGP